jgi:hypothetical protein
MNAVVVWVLVGGGSVRIGGGDGQFMPSFPFPFGFVVRLKSMKRHGRHSKPKFRFT